MNNSMSLTMLLVGAVFASTNLANAQNEALYGAEVPEDAAFVRFLDTSVERKAFGFAFPEAEADAPDTFTPVSSAALEGAEAGAFYSVAGPDLVIGEPAREDRRKVYVVLTNASDSPLRLMVQDGPEVIGEVAPGEAGARGVNPVSVTFLVDAENDALDTAFEVQLRRDQDVTFFATNEGVRLIEDSLGPVAGN